MNNKFFDIIPPEKIKEDKVEVKKKPKRRAALKVSLFLFLLLFLLLLFGFFLFPRAELEIKPQMSGLKITEKVIIDLQAEQFSFEDKIIPGQVFEDTRTVEKEFSSTGKGLAEKKASGTIVVYNEYSSSSRTLIPSRFVSAEGKLFWSTEKITVPGYKKEGGKIIPGEKEVRVEAAEPGEEYNIGPTTFALPALAGSGLYTTIYAKSFSPMQGGAIGEVLKVEESDLKTAEQELALLAKEESKSFLMGSLPEGYTILDETISQQILTSSASAEAGDLKDSFIFQAEIESQGFAFKKEDMDKLIAEIIKLNIDEKKVKDLNVSYSLESAESERLSLKVSIEAQTYKDINVSDLKKALLGKDTEEANTFLNSLNEISEFNLKIKPFLRTKIPEDMEKVEVLIILD